MSVEEHHRKAQSSIGTTPARCAVLTISDTRTADTDRSGDLLVQHLTDAGHLIDYRTIVPDESEVIGRVLDDCLTRPIDLLLTTGGTGIAPRDGTIEVIAPRLTRELLGFGELFRALSFEEIGPAAMLSRAVGGVVARDAGPGLVLFALPGSPAAITLALTKLILPELAHMRALLNSAP